MKLRIHIVGVIAIALTACFHDSNDSAIPVISVLTVSGVTMSLDGRWDRPCDTNSPAEDGTDYLVSVTISGASAVHGDYSYTSSDGSCTGVETADFIVEVTGKVGVETAIAGWVDLGCNPASAPLAQDGSGPLSDNESVTTITGTINSVTPANPAFAPGMEITSFYVVDDTVASAPVMYEKGDCGNNTAFTVPYTLQ